jgi:transcriptional regulator with XRE-family HTH domain
MLFSAITFCAQSAKPASAMAPMLAPEVRLQFAKRLKTMRTQRGFDRARYFARSLGIEENRYTRYERAEVEPSLTLIHKMCETLRVSPNELLGFADSGQAFEPAPGLAEAAVGEIAQTPRRDGGGHGPDAVSTLAWRLAAEAVAIRHEQPGKSKTAAGDALETVRETGALFRSLQARPFETAAELAADPALERVDGKRRAALAGLIRAYTDSLSEARPARVRPR